MRENGLGPIHYWIFCNQIRRDLHFIRQIAGLEKVPRTFIILSVTRSSRSDPCSSRLIVVSPGLRWSYFTSNPGLITIVYLIDFWCMYVAETYNGRFYESNKWWRSTFDDAPSVCQIKSARDEEKCNSYPPHNITSRIYVKKYINISISLSLTPPKKWMMGLQIVGL